MDYPAMAMTAARLGEPQKAVDALMMKTPKNRYLPNGHNFQDSSFLPLYLPGNGGLLYAVAMMAAGWDGCPNILAPRFPQDGDGRSDVREFSLLREVEPRVSAYRVFCFDSRGDGRPPQLALARGVPMEEPHTELPGQQVPLSWPNKN
jgi:hypothetical protein